MLALSFLSPSSVNYNPIKAFSFSLALTLWYFWQWISFHNGSSNKSHKTMILLSLYSLYMWNVVGFAMIWNHTNAYIWQFSAAVVLSPRNAECNEWKCSLLNINRSNMIVFIQVKCNGSVEYSGWCRDRIHFRNIILLNRNEHTSCIKYNFIKHFSFHWHYYQYRNKIPLKQENTAMLYQLETFTTLKFCMFNHRTWCQEKIYFHIIIFFLIVYNFCILPIIKRHLEKLKYWHNISQMCKKT